MKSCCIYASVLQPTPSGSGHFLRLSHAKTDSMAGPPCSLPRQLQPACDALPSAKLPWDTSGGLTSSDNASRSRAARDDAVLNPRFCDTSHISGQNGPFQGHLSCSCMQGRSTDHTAAEESKAGPGKLQLDQSSSGHARAPWGCVVGNTSGQKKCRGHKSLNAI